MRRLFGFLAIVLIPATTLFAQHHGGGSSGGSSGSSSSSSSPSPSYSPPSYSPPSYSPPSSSGNSRSNDGGSRSSDSGSRSYDPGSHNSSSSSSSSGGSNSPSAPRGGSEPSSRGSSSSSSSSSYHPSSTSNSSGNSNTGSVRDFRNGPQVNNKHEFPASIRSREPESRTFRGTEQPASRGSIPSNNKSSDVTFSRPGQPSSGTRLPADPELTHKFAPKEWKIQQQHNKLDVESNKLYTKYKLAGKDVEYDRRQAKLDEKRNKLLDKERKLAKQYQLAAEKKYKPCTGTNCPGVCPPGQVATHRGGCAAGPPNNQNLQCGYGNHQEGSQCVQDRQCSSGYHWDGRECATEAYNLYGSSVGNCSEYYTRLRIQERILNDLQRSQAAACGIDLTSAECLTLTQQVSAAEEIYRQLSEEYRQCLLHY